MVTMVSPHGAIAQVRDEAVEVFEKNGWVKSQPKQARKPKTQ